MSVTNVTTISWLHSLYLQSDHYIDAVILQRQGSGRKVDDCEVDCGRPLEGRFFCKVDCC